MYFSLLSHPCKMLPLYPPPFYTTFHTNMQVAHFVPAGILQSLQSICFFTEFDPNFPMEVLPPQGWIVFIFFFYCVYNHLSRKLNTPTSTLTYIFNLAAICNSIPKNQFDVCGRSFLQRKKELSTII